MKWTEEEVVFLLLFCYFYGDDMKTHWSKPQTYVKLSHWCRDIKMAIMHIFFELTSLHHTNTVKWKEVSFLSLACESNALCSSTVVHSAVRC